jgi:hypothetical protein
MDGQGTSSDYLLRRIARDCPDLLKDIGKDKRLKSARAAAIEAGIIIPFPSLQLKDPAPTAQKLLAKKGQAWCLQLLEELSELCYGKGLPCCSSLREKPTILSCARGGDSASGDW